MLPEPLQHRLADLASQRIVLGQLQVVFGARRLVAGGDAAIEPFGRFERGADAGHLFCRKDLGDA